MNESEFNASPVADNDRRKWAMLLHLSILTAHVVPILGLIAPIAVWQLKKDQYPEIDEHGKNVVNWLLSMLLYVGVSIALCFVFIGIPLITACGLASVICPVIAAIKANNGEVWRYPLTIEFIS